jgi:hypothetical protein
LSRRYSDADRYQRELADWHVRWEPDSTLADRVALLGELERIEPPAASVDGMQRHRQYVRAHQLAVLTQSAAGSLVERVRSHTGDRNEVTFGCETIRDFASQAGSIREHSGIELDWVVGACAARDAAWLNLGEVRSAAHIDWLRDAIDAARPVGEVGAAD